MVKMIGFHVNLNRSHFYSYGLYCNILAFLLRPMANQWQNEPTRSKTAPKWITIHAYKWAMDMENNIT